MPAGPIDFTTAAPVVGRLPGRWIHGAPGGRRGRRPAGRIAADPPIQVHAHDPHTFVLRQSKSVHYEAPFMYLFCGNDRALLLDTGATSDPRRFPLRDAVDEVLTGWLARHPRTGYELVVAHSHDHADHVAADGQFLDRPGTTVVPLGGRAVREYFAIADPTSRPVMFDLGGRPLQIIGCPGHQDASIAVFDPWTGWLMTGDTVYPGRLYVEDMPAFVTSLNGLVDLARSRGVTRVMGCHIEMRDTAGADYPVGSRYQPAEAALPMTVDQLIAVRDAASSIRHRPGRHNFDDFIIHHGPCRMATLHQHLRRLFAPAAGKANRSSTSVP